MATYVKKPLSGNAVGGPIKVAATTSPGTVIHTSESSSSITDEVWLYAYNSSSVSVTLTLQYAGTSSPDNDIMLTMPSRSGLVLVVPGLVLIGTGSAGTSVRAYSSVANVITVSGYVNRIT
jgi:hypothetical protein